MIALLMPVFLCVAGFAIDGGRMYFSANRLASAVKIAAIESTMFIEINENGELESSVTDSDIEQLIKKNMENAELVSCEAQGSDYSVSCSIEGAYKVDFVFMKIFGIKSKELYSSFTATRGIS